MATIRTKDGEIEIPDGDPRIQAHDALSGAARRICEAAYREQMLKLPAKRRARGMGSFSPPPEAAELTAAMPKVLDGTLDPEAAMNLLMRGDIFALRTGTGKGG